LLSVRLRGEFLDVKFETFLQPNEFRYFTDALSSLSGSFFNKEKNVWVIPKEHIDIVEEIVGEKAAWFNSVEEIKGISEVVLPKFNITTDGLEDMLLQPFPFQAIGISFLHDIQQGLLADEMGLGKTPQAIGAVHRLWKEGNVRKALVICPSSLKYQWAQEIQKFTDYKSIVIDGSPKERLSQYQQWEDENDILFAVTNYELARNDIDQLVDRNYDAIIVDEVHRIKNWASKTSQALKQLHAPYKFGLTGTPIQNRPEELYNIMDFLNPEILGNWWAFRNRYVVSGEKFGQKNVVIGYKHLGELRKRVAPYMLRRMKKDVAPELPEIIINDYHIEMTLEQQRLDETIGEDLKELLKEIQEWHQGRSATVSNDIDTEPEKHPKQDSSLGYFTMMLEICDSPELLMMSDSRMAQHYSEDLDPKKVKSPKLDELEEIAQDQLEAGNHKIVIFTQFARMQKLIVDRLSKIGRCEILNGSMKPFERQAAVDRFKYDDEVNFFVTTDAGNYGINLQFASVLVHVDLPWNPAIYDQRCGRIHRIGSSFKEVTIINLIARGGIDERIQQVLYKKRELSNQLIEKNDEERAEMNRLTSGLMNKLLKPATKKRGKGA
jgi:SNF2 family DNA or RNA helicase